MGDMVDAMFQFESDPFLDGYPDEQDWSDSVPGGVCDDSDDNVPIRWRNSRGKPAVWINAKGERIAIAEMTDGHLANTIRLLSKWRRMKPYQRELLQALRTEQTKRHKDRPDTAPKQLKPYKRRRR